MRRRPHEDQQESPHLTAFSIWNFPSPDLGDITFLLVKPPGCGTSSLPPQDSSTAASVGSALQPAWGPQ